MQRSESLGIKTNRRAHKWNFTASQTVARCEAYRSHVYGNGTNINQSSVVALGGCRLICPKYAPAGLYG